MRASFKLHVALRIMRNLPRLNDEKSVDPEVESAVSGIVIATGLLN